MHMNSFSKRRENEAETQFSRDNFLDFPRLKNETKP